MTAKKAKVSPLVSIIMPAYNCELYIEAAVQSILDQTYKDFELIIVNDCSTDNTGQIIDALTKKDSRIKVFHNKNNIKQTRTRNFAIKQAKGAYIALMDGDDIRQSTSIAKQVDFLEEHPKVVVVGTGAAICDQQMKHLNDRLYPLVDSQIRRTFFRYSPFCLASLMIRSDKLEQPAYNAELEPAEDIDLAMRLGKVGRLANLPEVLYKVRTHKQSVTQVGARLMEKNTLYVRIKAVAEYGYHITLTDKLYFAVQLGTMYLMPPRFRFWLFNMIRSR